MNYDMIMNTSLIVSAVALVSFLLYRGKKKEASKIILALVKEAENVIGSGKGGLKYAYVVEKVYLLLPSMIKAFITKKILDTMIERAVDKLELN